MYVKSSISLPSTDLDLLNIKVVLNTIDTNGVLYLKTCYIHKKHVNIHIRHSKNISEI